MKLTLKRKGIEVVEFLALKLSITHGEIVGHTLDNNVAVVAYIPTDVVEIEVGEVQYLKCMSCYRIVSTGYIPLPTETPDKRLITRAYIECPECIQKSGRK